MDYALNRTLVMPMAPIFSLYDVVPVPVPNEAAIIQPMPSTKTPDGTYDYADKYYKLNTCRTEFTFRKQKNALVSLFNFKIAPVIEIFPA